MRLIAYSMLNYPVMPLRIPSEVLSHASPTAPYLYAPYVQGVTEARITVECLKDDCDLQSILTRELFEGPEPVAHCAMQHATHLRYILPCMQPYTP